jgi:plasmid maintenance system killer protein
MEITFKNKKLEKALSTSRDMVALHGARRAKLIQQRLSEIEAAPTLAMLRFLPRPRCHELKGNRKGQLSVDLDHPYRLLFTPDHDPLPQAPAGGLDWAAVTRVCIQEIVDTHE